MIELSKIQNKFPKIIKEIRGKGLMIGLQFFEDPSKFLKEFYKNKLITVKASDNVIRILPPLNVKKKEIDEGIKIIKKTLQEYKVIVKNFINIRDISIKDLKKILFDAKKRKAKRKKLNYLEPDKDIPLKGRFLIQMFEKSSTRTRLSFYLAIRQLGGGVH